MILAVQKSWFAVLNENDIVEEVLQMPSSVEGSEFIKIPAEDQSLIGMRYNRVTGKFEIPVYYYAELDEKGIVVEIITSSTPQEKDNWIKIPSADQSLVGKWYDKENDRFIDPPAFVIAAHSTDEICYKYENKWLSKKLDEMDAAIAENAPRCSISQMEVRNVIVPKQVDLAIKDDGTFRLPPVEVLKLVSEASDGVVTVRNEAVKFEQNDSYIFGDAVELKTVYTVPVRTVAFADGYVSESDEFDFKKIEKVVVM